MSHKKNYRFIRTISFILALSFLMTSCARKTEEEPEVIDQEAVIQDITQPTEQDPVSGPLSLAPVSSLPEGGWIMEATFPDRNDDISTTLAMNSMASFKGYISIWYWCRCSNCRLG